ncbi:MAG: preprotein translocase subunit YajC [Rhodoglobus sp.]|nr:preprotein translocase subunit YajC [Rhodoglobus sp.]
MDPLTIGMLVILAVLIFFMFRNSRKRKAQQEELRSQIVPGAEVMTNFGLFGTLKSVDAATNVAELEVSPGNIVRVHSQTIAKVVSDETGAPGEPRSVEEAMAIANREAEERDRVKLNEDSAIPLDEPAYGERVTEEKKPARRTTKKAAE